MHINATASKTNSTWHGLRGRVCNIFVTQKRAATRIEMWWLLFACVAVAARNLPMDSASKFSAVDAHIANFAAEEEAMEVKLKLLNENFQEIYAKQQHEIASITQQISKLSQQFHSTFAQPNILYIKIPKTASSTFQRILYTIAEKHFTYRIPYIDPTVGEMIETCQIDDEKNLQVWQKYVNANGGKLDLFGLHACFHDFMLDPKYWSHNAKPFMLTLLRNPWDHFVSTHRYHKLCCTKGEAWCQPVCRYIGDFVQFNEVHCANDYCSQQTIYLGGSLDQYDLVMVVEKLDESLALLALKLNLPTHVLFYIAENANVNTSKRIDGLTVEMEDEVKRTFLKTDYVTYNSAIQRLESEIASLHGEKLKKYQATLRELRLGNRRLANRCVKECKFDGFAIDTCMKSCWSSELCEMGKQVQWW